MATDAVRRPGVWAAIDERFGLSDLAYSVPRHANTLQFSLGGISMVSLPELANDSVRTMMPQFGLARLARGIHYWAAQVFLVTVLLHMISIFLTASFKRPREANWVVGVLLLGISVALYFTGTVLKWDQEGFEALEHNLAIGHLLGGLWHWFAPSFSQAAPLLLRRYIAHIVVLPSAIFFVLIVHFWLIKKHGISPIPGNDGGEMLRFTSHLAHLAMYAAVLAGFILILTVLLPPVIGPAPVEGIEVTKPPWPFLPLFAVENWVGVPGLLWVSLAAFVMLALALGAVVVLTLVGLALLAWITKGAEHLGWLLSI